MEWTYLMRDLYRMEKNFPFLVSGVGALALCNSFHVGTCSWKESCPGRRALSKTQNTLPWGSYTFMLYDQSLF